MDELADNFERIRIDSQSDDHKLKDSEFKTNYQTQSEHSTPIYQDKPNDDESDKILQYTPMEPEEIFKLVQVDYVPGKGNCLFTKNYVVAGDVIFVEAPLFTILPEWYQELWDLILALHTEKPLELAPIWHLATLASLIHGGIERRKKLLLKWAPKVKSIHPDVIRITENIEVLKNLNEVEYKQMLHEYQRLIQMWPCNAFGHSTYENGLLLYECMSYVSHSCFPSCCWHHEGEGNFVLRAIRYLNPGDEITISYLSEHDLLCSRDIRRYKLTNWAFECNCERCILPIDNSRGFICSNCQIGTIFLQEDKTSKCTSCHSSLTPEQVEECLRFDEDYKNRINTLDKTDYEDVMHVYERAQDIFKQHWILYTLESYIYEYFSKNLVIDRINRMQLSRINYIEQSFGGATYTASFIYEELGDSVATEIGLDFKNEELGNIDDYSRSMMAKYYYRSAALLQILCGSNHDYFLSVYSKLNFVKNTNI